ncbi:hypothetical protein AU195_16720 [Mycobacterium sp. IS-1496]|nr:hypothetical protein AU195_16720 [Mycobacterium sp. IS-1496]
MHLTSIHRLGSYFGLVAAVTLAGTACGGEPETGSSNRGSGSDTESTTVENAFIVPAFLPGRCAIQVDTGAKMRFTVTNNHPSEDERLVGLSTNATVNGEIVSGVDIPRESSVGFGQPSAPAVDAGGEVPAVELGELAPTVRPGMSASVTFRFDRAGDIEMPVPVEACPTQDR